MAGTDRADATTSLTEHGRVLVTGGSGFLAAHCVVRLLREGYAVRTTVRSRDKADRVRRLVHAEVGAGSVARLEVVHTDLTENDGWDAAVTGCDFVLHVASPFPATAPAHEDDLITPAREGTLRVLRAATRAGVRRVVVTSSFAAVCYGHAPTTTPYDESSWTDVDARGVTAYARSKTLAEHAAWEYIREHGEATELAVVNPTGILGPALGHELGTSVASIALLLDGKAPVLPRAWIGVVDVRDVADLHLRAMTRPAAAGERFIATAGTMTLPEIARLLKDELGDDAGRVSTRTIPDWLVRLVALADGNVRQTLPMLGTPHHATSAHAEQLLGWRPRPAREAVLATARSVLAHRQR